MNLLVAIIFLTNFGFDNINIAEEATIVNYTQSNSSLTLHDVDFGSTIGAYFNVTQNWQTVQTLRILAEFEGENPNSTFSIYLYSGPNLDHVKTYQGSTDGLTISNQPGYLDLQVAETGEGTMADIKGVQFTWDGVQTASNFRLLEFVDFVPNPKVTFCGFELSHFVLRWTGTGVLPVNVQRTTDLTNGSWTTVATNITGGEYIDSSTPSTRAFYRVVVP